MAKRNTTGMPRKERDLEARKRLSKAEKDRYYQQFALIGAVVIIGIIAVVLLGALIWDFVYIPQQSITEVNGEGIKTSDFQKRVKAERWLLSDQLREYYDQTGSADLVRQQLDQLDAVSIGTQILNDMELQVLLEQEAERRGVKVDEDWVQSQVDNYITLLTNRSLTPTPTSEPTEPTTPTATLLITATPSNTPAPTNTPTNTPLPTVTDCEGDDCATVTPIPTATITPTATETPDQTPTPTNTPLGFNDVKATVEKYESNLYNNADDDASIDRDTLRDIFYFRALREALQEDVTNELIATGDLKEQRLWANTRHILISVPTELQPTGEFDASICSSEEWAPYRDEALQVLEMLNNGEPFATLAEAMSDDPGSAANGGMLGEEADVEGTYVTPFAQAIKTGEIGAYIGPVCTQFGYHIIQVFDREVRDIPEAEMDSLKGTAYSEWENNLLAGADIQRVDDWLDRIPEKPDFEKLLDDILNP